MSDPVPEARRGPAERLLAWVFTGPLGHFHSVVVDLLVFATRLLVERSRRRLAQGAGRRLSGEGNARRRDR